MSDIERTNNDLVFAGDDGEPFTTSLVIAAETGNEHSSVIKLIRNYVDDMNEVGTSRFEIAKSGGRPTEYAELDEPAAALLITYLKNTAPVRDFKKRLVRDFYAMRQALARRAAVPAIPQTREQRLALALVDATDIINEQSDQIKALEAPARSWQLLADAHGDFSVAEAAKILSRDPSITTGRGRLFDYMAEKGWIFKSKNPRGGWEAYQAAVNTGRLCERPARPFLNSKTGLYELPAPTIRVTAKGIGKLHELMGGTEPIRFVVGEAS